MTTFGSAILGCYNVVPTISAAKTLVTDNFNRANGNPISANWSTPTGVNALGIYNQQAANTIQAGHAASYWSANTFSNDQYSKAKPTGVLATYRYPRCGVRMGGANGEGYYISTDGTDTQLIYRSNAGSETVKQTLTGTGFLSTDIMEVRAQGTTISMWKNGSQIGTNTTDANIASGYPGGAANPDTYAEFDDWEGGDL